MCKIVTTESFIERAKEVHGDTYDYSKTIYTTNKKLVEIICLKHGSYFQRAASHLFGYGCKKCGDDKVRLTTEDFIKKSNEVHGNLYDYSQTVYVETYTKVIIGCRKCGNFLQKPDSHTHGKGKGCPKCKNSKGEISIESYLKSKEIPYQTQKKFSDCKHIKALPFDFYLPNHNLLIEFQGQQHYKPVEIFGKAAGFEKVKRNDNIKRNFAKSNNINLLEISFENINSIESILDDYLLEQHIIT